MIWAGTVFMDLYVPLCMAVALVVTNDFFLFSQVFFILERLSPFNLKKKFLLINIVI